MVVNDRIQKPDEPFNNKNGGHYYKNINITLVQVKVNGSQ